MISNRVLNMKAPPIYELMEMARKHKDVIYLNLGEPSFDTPDFIKKAAIEAITKGKTKYTGSMGVLELRRLIAEYESSYIKHELSKDNVIITTGGTLALAATLLAFTNPKDEFMVLDPWWPGHPRCVILADAIPKPVPLKENEGYSLDLDAINRNITPRTRGIIIVNPNNPTGALFKVKELKALLEIAQDKKLIVVADETYDKLVYEEKFVSMGEIAENLDNLVIIRSFSKNFAMTGWRIGYIVSSKENIKALQKMNLALSLSPPSVSQYAAMAVLKESDKAEEAVKKMVNGYKRRRDIVVKYLKESKVFKFGIPKGTFYIFPRYVNLNLSSLELIKYILNEAHVLVSPGYLYFGYTGEQHIRISYSNNTEVVEEGMKRLKGAIIKLIEKGGS